MESTAQSRSDGQDAPTSGSSSAPTPVQDIEKNDSNPDGSGSHPRRRRRNAKSHESAPKCLQTCLTSVQSCADNLEDCSDRMESREIERRRRRRGEITDPDPTWTGRGNRPDPVWKRKGIIPIVCIILIWVYIIFTWRICYPSLRPTPTTNEVISKSSAIVLITLFNILWLLTIWSYIKVLFTGPGYVKDYIATEEQPMSITQQWRQEQLGGPYLGGDDTEQGEQKQHQKSSSMIALHPQDELREQGHNKSSSMIALHPQDELREQGHNKSSSMIALHPQDEVQVDETLPAIIGPVGAGIVEADAAEDQIRNGSHHDQHDQVQVQGGQASDSQVHMQTEDRAANDHDTRSYQHQEDRSHVEGGQTSHPQVQMQGEGLPVMDRDTSSHPHEHGHRTEGAQVVNGQETGSHLPEAVQAVADAQHLASHGQGEPYAPSDAIDQTQTIVPPVSHADNTFSHSQINASHHPPHNGPPPPPTRQPPHPDYAPFARANRYCHRCTHVKALRAHHCRHCGTCVLKMDHHCPWVGGCVGARNHKFFFHFVFWVTLLEFYVLTSSAIVFSKGISTSQWTIDGFIISLFPICAVFILFTLPLLITHTYLLISNQSTIEYLAFQRTSRREEVVLSEYFSKLNKLNNEKKPIGYNSFAEKRKMKKLWDQEWGKLKWEINLWKVEIPDRSNGNAGQEQAGWKSMSFSQGLLQNWKQTMGLHWWMWIVPIGSTPNDGLDYPLNPRHGPYGEWRKRQDWPKELQ
ncbi:unnamed protein product [Sympodiomycopsis kandeliae]